MFGHALFYPRHEWPKALSSIFPLPLKCRKNTPKSHGMGLTMGNHGQQFTVLHASLMLFFSFYLTQVNLRSDLWVRMSVRE